MFSMTNTFVECLFMTNYLKMLNLCSSSLHIKNKLHTFPLNKKYRGHFEIIALLLEAVKDNGATRFSIMKYASTNYKQLEKYLDGLTEIGFVEMDMREGQCLYKATEKGLNFLRQYYVLLGALLSAFEKSKSANIVYEAEYDTATARHPICDRFTAHSLTEEVERQAEYP
jgi:predicted transcriptional regulator